MKTSNMPIKMRIASKLLFIALIQLLHIGVFAQTPKAIRYRITEVGRISIAAELELISGKYKKLEDSIQLDISRLYDYDIYDRRAVFQQKGLNNSQPSSFQTYVRIIIETFVGKPGEYPKLSSRPTLKPNELAAYDASFKQGIVAGFKEQRIAKMHLSLVKWLGSNTVIVNGKAAIQTTYIRQLNARPPVKVEMYQFFNNDRMHQVILSYRIEDEKQWKPILTKALSSFQITNVR